MTPFFFFDEFERQPWYRDAPCHGSMHLFFAEDQKPIRPGWEKRPPRTDREKAMHLCMACPYRDQCLEVALTVPASRDFGIWGGTTVTQRRAMRRGRSAA